MATVTLQGIVKSYDGKTNVIHGVDLRIEHGEFVVFVGPSGCGKSTLLRMVAGLESISGGEVRIDDTVVNDLPPRSRDIAMVFQDYALYPHKTLYDNMAFGLRLRKTPQDEVHQRVMDAAKLLKIESMLERKPGQLSGGQRQRVAIGRAIVRQPKVFLFDEPLSNLDAQLRGEMRSEIKRLHQRLGATIIYVTHDQVEAMTMADRIAVLSAGRVMQYDTPDRIYNHPAALFVAGFTGAPPMNLVPCKLQGSQLSLGAGLMVGLTPSMLAQAQQKPSLKLGLRPEKLRLAAERADDASAMADVVLVEPLGAETLATLRLGEVEMIARLPAGFNERPGSRVQVHWHASDLHLFDADSGASLAS
jgi:multiple sugar transport system ATP-binding protein